MLTRLVTSLSVTALFSCAVAVIQPQTPARTSPSNPLIREERKIVVNGIPEVWRLQWKSPSKPACEAEDFESSYSCPCSGFAYGEVGQLDLVRIVNGRELDRLELTPLFEETDANQGGAIVQRWKFDVEDLKRSESEDFVAQVHARPVVTIMNFADYNHDGHSTEFFLQTDTYPCGKTAGVVIGLTPDNPRLHIFGTALHPDKPLVLQKREWVALLNANNAIEVVDWPCGDHGSETLTIASL
jgi:hypothetical protein